MNAHSHRGDPIDRAMAEFFVMRQYRRAGVGRAAAHAVFARHPGRWELAIAARNAGALDFWPAVVATTPGVRDIITSQGDGESWAGPILSFTIAVAVGDAGRHGR